MQREVPLVAGLLPLKINDPAADAQGSIGKKGPSALGVSLDSLVEGNHGNAVCIVLLSADPTNALGCLRTDEGNIIPNQVIRLSVVSFGLIDSLNDLMLSFHGLTSSLC